jgi:hypothetical protein
LEEKKLKQNEEKENINFNSKNPNLISADSKLKNENPSNI